LQLLVVPADAAEPRSHQDASKDFVGRGGGGGDDDDGRERRRRTSQSSARRLVEIPLPSLPDVPAQV